MKEERATGKETEGGLYIGLMSGTSLDGIDAALMEFTPEGKGRCLGTLEYGWDRDTSERLKALIEGKNRDFGEALILHRRAGEGFAAAALALVRRMGLRPMDIRAIGSHGQTVLHLPDKGVTLQLGSGAVISSLTGIDTVTDFRMKDMAHGGQGAPLVPPFHDALFRREGETVIVLNIGGISNVTLLRPGEKARGWDTGPGNTMLDLWYRKSGNAGAYDRDGKFAQSGSISEALLEEFLREPYFAARPPKSTGRELFNLSFIERSLKSLSARGIALPSPADVERTLLRLTAITITMGIRDALNDGEHAEILAAGGGVHNALLLDDIRECLLNLSVCADLGTAEDAGIDSDFLEAEAFAWLAWCRVNGVRPDLSAVTGASVDSVPGALYLGH
ncbi:MAG: anhydro-N-acetylmuramic acid kinase [Pseudomonadota bacterium]|jgi:anhydro-N-acetylmuramic acid kinase|nr:anhydro-N-acetylmuramic acid kinase [Pseudomonadota bacterium]MDY6336536.1 anhydro-N-acetylmuramic acid kinase [Succinivibrionaceae bacterium]MDY6377051.1 anhydro-N-acetylmuramic acid kinase [Succinivibrionaceae bacterium]